RARAPALAAGLAAAAGFSNAAVLSAAGAAAGAAAGLAVAPISTEAPPRSPPLGLPSTAVAPSTPAAPAARGLAGASPCDGRIFRCFHTSLVSLATKFSRVNGLPMYSDTPACTALITWSRSPRLVIIIKGTAL